MLAISQSDGKKVLAYSTVSNLGLIAACAGVGMHEAVWAGVLLMMFHAVSKSLMFLSVGAVENSIGSRNIEDMHGLIVKLPEMAFVMIVGIAGMFLAPFGMLISCLLYTSAVGHAPGSFQVAGDGTVLVEANKEGVEHAGA